MPAPLQELTNNDAYNFSSLTYPQEVQDNVDHGHYVNFFINVHTASKYLQGSSYTYKGSPRSYTATSATSPGGITPGDNSSSVAGQIQQVTHNRITQAISLYIPDSMNYGQTIEWENASLMGMGVELAKTLGNYGSSKSASDAIGKGIKKNALKSNSGKTSGDISSLLSGLTNFAGDAGAAFGFAMNPQLLVLFRGIGFRSFQYEFYFTPKNAAEAESVRNIIKAFRFHSHPETMLGYGAFYIAPSTFDIEFMHKGSLNKNIHKVKTCVLKHYDVDYAPFGWSTYTDGMPIQTRLTLQFQETEIITKEQIEEGF